MGEERIALHLTKSDPSAVLPSSNGLFCHLVYTTSCADLHRQITSVFSYNPKLQTVMLSTKKVKLWFLVHLAGATTGLLFHGQSNKYIGAKVLQFNTKEDGGRGGPSYLLWRKLLPHFFFKKKKG